MSEFLHNRTEAECFGRFVKVSLLAVPLLLAPQVIACAPSGSYGPSADATAEALANKPFNEKDYKYEVLVKDSRVRGGYLRYYANQRPQVGASGESYATLYNAVCPGEVNIINENPEINDQELTQIGCRPYVPFQFITSKGKIQMIELPQD